ncbi:MAG: type VI secretion system tube protein Hcp [Ginsengibacter sp.]
MKKIISLFIVAGLFICSRSLAQNQIFIKAVGTPGPGLSSGVFDGGSSDEGHRNEIEAFAYSDGLAGCTNSSNGGSSSVCKISKTPFSFSMPMSFATISFKYNLLLGKAITSVDMVIRKNVGERPFEFYKVHMETVQVVSISEGASSESPIFNLELQPQKIAWQVIQQSRDGIGDKFSYGWDFSANKAFSYVFP